MSTAASILKLLRDLSDNHRWVYWLFVCLLSLVLFGAHDWLVVGFPAQSIIIGIKEWIPIFAQILIRIIIPIALLLFIVAILLSLLDEKLSIFFEGRNISLIGSIFEKYWNDPGMVCVVSDLIFKAKFLMQISVVMALLFELFIPGWSDVFLYNKDEPIVVLTSILGLIVGIPIAINMAFIFFVRFPQSDFLAFRNRHFEQQ